MLTVKTYLAPSGIHGIGLYAAEDIPEGSPVWRFTPGIDLAYSVLQFRRICCGLDETALRHLSVATYKRSNRYFLVTDNTRFINHSDFDYNVVLIDDYTEIAMRDIRCGEEILENYNLSYDNDDLFFLEMKNICEAERMLVLPAKERRRFLVKSKDVH